MPQQLLRYRKAASICLLLISIIANKANSQIITTVAGNGTAGYNGDSIAATSAALYSPYSVAFDGNGNLYISDLFNYRIRKVNTKGIISTVAGNGIQSYSGDGGAATSAELIYVGALAVDKYRNLYFTDYDRIRKVDSNGIISTIAGNASNGYSGDGGSALLAELNDPYGITTDASGNIYIADTYNNRIRKVDTNGIITTVVGNGTPGYSGDGGNALIAELWDPRGIVFDTYGNLYITDCYNNRIRKVDTKGIITTVAGTGIEGYNGDGMSAVSAQLAEPETIAVDSSGNLYIADVSNERIRMINKNGIISTIAGNGLYGYNGDGINAHSAEFEAPFGIALDTLGNLYIADHLNNRIRMISTIGLPVTILNFNVIENNNTTLLNWQTATEINTAYFNIQSSTNGRDFATVGRVNAKGAGSYNFNDPLTIDDSRFTKLYYRLEIVDKDGKISYSEIRSVLLTTQDSRLTIMPNPAKDVVCIAAKGMMHISVMDNTGKIVMNKSLDNIDNTSINITHLTKGVYYVSVKNNTGKVQSGKMVVE